MLNATPSAAALFGNPTRRPVFQPPRLSARCSIVGALRALVPTTARRSERPETGRPVDQPRRYCAPATRHVLRPRCSRVRCQAPGSNMIWRSGRVAVGHAKLPSRLPAAAAKVWVCGAVGSMLVNSRNASAA